jgi:uncharacterized SAM-binding protein YcdF (DUF218 family)
MPRSRVGSVLLRTAMLVTVIILVLLLVIGISGLWVFTRAKEDALERVDAIVVLGGEHDGREEYGLSLARQGLAATVVLSNPYRPDDPIMRRFCADRHDGIEVICRSPVPSTTRGEALIARQLATERNWHRIIVVTWRFHLPRARLVFAQCFSPESGSATFRAVPRAYYYSVVRWELTYLYQYTGFVKALTQGRCE